MHAADANLRRPAVKVCGLTRESDALLCAALGIDFTGFIFAPKSPRRVSPAAAAILPTGKAVRVGVFAGQPVNEVLKIMDEARLDYAQLHGGEDEKFCRAIGPERVIKVIWPEKIDRPADALDCDTEQLHEICRKFEDCCAYLLLDAGVAGGGSGKELSRQSLKNFTPARPWFLAGGIGPENALSALAECLPFGLDCNSTLESAPGIKDPKKLRDLMKIINTLRAF